MKIPPALAQTKGKFPVAVILIMVLTRKNIRFDSPYIKNLIQNVLHFPQELVDMRTQMLENHQRTNFDLLDKPCHLSDWAAKQTYIALGNMMSAATMIGIDSCPTEGFNKLEINSLLAEHCQVNPEQFEVSYGLAFGYRNKPQPKKTRQTLEEITQWFS